MRTQCIPLRLSPKKRPKPKNGCGTVFLGGKTPSNRRRKRATHFGSEPTRDACLRPPSVLLRLHRAESGPLEGDSRSCARAFCVAAVGDRRFCVVWPLSCPRPKHTNGSRIWVGLLETVLNAVQELTAWCYVKVKLRVKPETKQYHPILVLWIYDPSMSLRQCMMVTNLWINKSRKP